jgi:hypothetical protein
MLSNKISKQIEKIPFFNRSGTQSITFVEDARKLIATIPVEHRKDPNTTYQDRQCGTGLDALILAEQLMIDLRDAIPDEAERLNHIFKNQIYLSDIDPIQARITRANIINAVNDRTFDPNVTVQNCFTVDFKATYTFGSIDFTTTNEFVEHYLKLSDHITIITRSNKHRYVDSKLSEIDSYEFLRKFQNNPPICIINIPKIKTNAGVTFIDGTKSKHVLEPKIVPTFDFAGWLFAQNVLEKNLQGYKAQSGPENNEKFNPVPGDIPLVFKGWMEDAAKGKKLTTSRNKKGEPLILTIGKASVTEKMGYGIEKLMVPKNGNLGRIPNFYWDDGRLACSAQVNWIPMTQDEFTKLTDAINNEACYNTLFKAVLIKTHTKDFWSKIPMIKYLDKVKEIYDAHYD